MMRPSDPLGVLWACAVIWLALVFGSPAPQYVQPDVVSVSGIPYAIFQADSALVVDRAGHRFVMATTNGSAKGGIYVWEQETDGAPLVEVLAPGSDAYVGGSLYIGADGLLYLTAANQAADTIRAWKVPGWVP